MRLVYWAAILAGIYFLYLAFWYQSHMDAIVGIPYVMGCATIGLLSTAWGIVHLIHDHVERRRDR